MGTLPMLQERASEIESTLCARNTAHEKGQVQTIKWVNAGFAKQIYIDTFTYIRIYVNGYIHLHTYVQTYIHVYIR